MSITKARYHGKYVYASAELKGEIVQCIYCGCNMYTRRFPGREEYCYARMPGEVHTNEACQRYEDKTNMPLLPPTAEEFILALLKPEKDKGNGTTGASGVEGPRTPRPEVDGLGPVSQVRSLTQLLKTGIFYEDPDEAVCEGAKCRFADIIILKKWANKIWKSENLTPIGLRVLEALWVGSLVVNRENPEKQENWEAKMARCFNDSKELWLTLPVNVVGKARYIRLCLDCKSCFAAIKDKLFVSGETENGKYSTYIPREPQLELLVAGNWVTMSKEDCHAKCPTHFCDGCIGTYWAKCNSGRQIALIKNKYKDIKEK